jgi:hypothetical protein
MLINSPAKGAVENVIVPPAVALTVYIDPGWSMPPTLTKYAPSSLVVYPENVNAVVLPSPVCSVIVVPAATGIPISATPASAPR